MNNLIHLDCSLRDGGYYNNWDFDEKLINNYLAVLSSVNVDFCEIGFRFLKNSGFKGACAFTTEEFLNSLLIPEKINIAIMLNASDLVVNEKFNFDNLHELIPVKSSKSKVKLVRVACHIENINHILPLFEFLDNYGYLSACNITQVSEKTDKDLDEISATLSLSKVKILYIADSLGSLSPYHIKRIAKLIRKNWTGPIGIHAHDNKGLALSNTLEAINSDITWLDTTITGIGRGPGNAKTEELVIELSKKNKKSLNLVPLIKIIKEEFNPLKNKYSWGSNIFYYLAGKYSIHPSYIQSMLSDSRYQAEDILESINYLKDQGGKKFNFDDLYELRKFYKGKPKGNWNPKTIFDNKDVLIIGTGAEVKKHENALTTFIKNKKPVVLAINTQSLKENKLINFRIACHPTRLFADIPMHLKLDQPLIIPLSMLPKKFSHFLEKKEILDYGIGISKGFFKCFDNYCMIPNSLVFSYSLAMVTGGCAKRIFLAGFDGYNSEDSRNDEINELLLQYKNSFPNSKVIALTPTKYKNIISKSVYGVL